eukprot:Nk52_evm41s343 gene=Nk52_evmTU41s343
MATLTATGNRNSIPMDHKLKAGVDLAEVIKSQDTALQMVHFMLSRVNVNEFLPKTRALCEFLKMNPQMCASLLKGSMPVEQKCAEVFSGCFAKRNFANKNTAEIKSILKKGPACRKRKFSEVSNDCESQKSVCFNGNKLEKVKYIPNKEQLRAGNQLNDNEFFSKSLDKVFWSKDYGIKKRKCAATGEISSVLPCLNNPAKCMGKSFLLKDDSVVKVVLVCRDTIFGKIFTRLGKLTSNTEKAQPATKANSLPKTLAEELEALHGSDGDELVETDRYVKINKSDVISECRIAYVEDTICNETDSETGGDFRDPPVKVQNFYYAWYYNTSQKKLIPYDLVSKSLKIYWPADKTSYRAKVTNVDYEHQKFCVCYELDSSVEWISLAQLRERNEIAFV